MNKELEEEFQATTKLLLGEKLNIQDCAGWLSRHVPLPTKEKSMVSGKDVWIPPPLSYLRKKYNPLRIFSMDEIDKVNKPTCTIEDLEGASVKYIVKIVKPLACACGNFRHWTYENVEESSGAGDCRNVHRSEEAYIKIKNVAFSNFMLISHNVFGSFRILESSFVINAYNSKKITRCVEVDSCSNSSGLLFCHNCENVHDSMFCFNAKNLRNAVGNIPLPPKKYQEIKSMVLKSMVQELKEKKTLKYDIYNVGSMP